MCKTPDSAVVGITSSEIVAENAHRCGLFIRNLSTNIVYLAFDHNAEVGKGIVLLPSEAFSMTPNDQSTSFVCAIASGAGSAIAIQEFDARCA